MYQYAGRVGETLMLVVCTSRTVKTFDTARTSCEQTAANVFVAQRIPPAAMIVDRWRRCVRHASR